MLYATTFLITMAVLGTVHSWWALAALPACVLIGAAFASCGLALVTYMRGWSDFEWIPTVTMPLFLFSASFYPASSYGRWRGVLQISPLYHGITLVRAATSGTASWSLVGHAAFLGLLTLGGLWVGSKRMNGLLLS
jgi:lipooligosaccharide transport system permease protein